MKNLIIVSLLLVSCSSLNDSKRRPSSLQDIPEKYVGKNFFKEYNAYSTKSLVGKHKIAIFIDWVRNNSIPLFETLRKEAPLFEAPKIPNIRKYTKDEEKYEGLQTLMVTLDKDVREVLSRPEIFTVKLYEEKMESSIGPYMLGHDKKPVNREKPWMRSVLRREDLPKVRQIVKRLTLNALKESNVNGRIELVNAVARRVPLELSGEYFGFPGPDLRTMYRWSRATQYSYFHNATNKEEIEIKAKAAGKEMHAHLKFFLSKKRNDKSYENEDTVLARLLKTNLQSSEMLDMYDGRVRTNMIGTLVGGVETTQAAIIQALNFLLDHPELFKEAREAARNGDDKLLAGYVWEALRFDPVNPFVFRYASKDYTLAKGTSRERVVQKGQILMVATHSAMFDPARVKNPKEFNPRRLGVNHPNTIYFHLGHGHHKCLGDYVAAVEVPEVIKHILLLPGLKKVDSNMGEIGHHDNIGPLDMVEDLAHSPFPESFVVEIDRPTPANKLTIADPRFLFEDYLMVYNRRDFRACLSNFKHENKYLNAFTSIRPNMKRIDDYTDARDLLWCRLPKDFRKCVKDSITNYKSCSDEFLTPNQKYFFGTEVLGNVLDPNKIPNKRKVISNSGYDFETDLKFYDRSDYRQTFMNPLGAVSFPVTEDKGNKQMIFYSRVDLRMRKCLAKNIKIKRKTRLEGFEHCMKDPKIRLDSLTEKYYRKIMLGD